MIGEEIFPPTSLSWWIWVKAIYEDFYTAYNPAAADRLGVVYTPNEVVDFIIRGQTTCSRSTSARPWPMTTCRS